MRFNQTAAVLCLAAAAPLWGQMTSHQRGIDFQSFVSLYAKQYAPTSG